MWEIIGKRGKKEKRGISGGLNKGKRVIYDGCISAQGII